jgi:hypothetical protein
MAVQPAGGDDRYYVGIGFSAPLRAETAGHFAEDDAGSQCPLAVVVGGGDVATGNEKEEITAAFSHALGELSSGLGGRGRRQRLVEPAVEIGAVLARVLS